MKQSPYISVREIQAKSGSTQSCCATPLIPENDVIMLKVSATPPYPFHCIILHTHLCRSFYGSEVCLAEGWCLHRWLWFTVDRAEGGDVNRSGSLIHVGVHK